MLCHVSNTEYGRVGFPIPTLEGISFVSSSIKLGQVSYTQGTELPWYTVHVGI